MRLAVLGLLAALVAAPVGAVSSPALAQAPGWLGGVEAPDREGDAAYAAPRVAIPGRIGGDVMILADQADIGGEVGDDARVMASRFHQDGAVGGELAVAARQVDIDGQIGDDLYVAADDVRLGGNARVGQDARIFGQDVLIKGRIDRNLDVSGETVALAAEIGGDVRIHARNIVFGPGVKIEGKLTWSSPNEPEVPEDTVIRGGVEGAVDRTWRREGMWSWASPFRNASSAAMFASEAAGRLMVALSAFAIGLILVLLTPHYSDRVFATVRERWAVSFGWGFLLLVLTPFVALLLMLTFIGIPLGFLLLLSIPLLCLCGYAAGAAGLGSIVLRGHTVGQRLIALAAGLAALTALAFVPFVGWLFGTIAVMLGLGAMAVAARPRAIVS